MVYEIKELLDASDLLLLLLLLQSKNAVIGAEKCHPDIGRGE